MNGRVLLALAAGMLAGYLGGRLNSHHAAPAPAEVAAPVDSPLPPTNSSVEQPRRSTIAELDLVHIELRLRSIKTLHDWKRSTALLELAKQIPIQSIPETLRLADSLLDRSDTYAFTTVLLEHWADADPRGLLAYGTTPPHTQHSDEAANLGAMEWARRDPGAALDWAMKRPPGENRFNFIREVLIATAETDPHRALKSLTAVPKGQRNAVEVEILSQLAKQSPEEALELAAKLPGLAWQPGGNAQIRILGQWMEQDHTAAANWIQAHVDDKGHRTDITGAIGMYAQEHPTEALKLAELLPPGSRRNTLLNQILPNCEDLGAIKAWGDSQTDPKLKSMGQLAYARVLSQTDPAAAAASIAGLKRLGNGGGFQGNGDFSQAADQIFQRYSAADPVAAMQLATSLPDFEMRKMAVSAAVGGWSGADPAGAANYVSKLPANQDRSQLLQAVARNWAEQDPNALIDWLKQGNGQAVSKSAVAEMLTASAQFAPAQAAEYARSINAGASQLSQIASMWSQNDPEAAFAWAASLPEGKTRDEIISQTLSTSMGADPEAAVELARKLGPDKLPASAAALIAGGLAEADIGEAQHYVDSLPEGETRDKALENMLQTWGRSNPEEAIAYAQKLPEGSSARTEGIATALGSLAERDPDAAFAFLAKAGAAELPEATSRIISTVANNDPGKASGWVSSLPDGPLKDDAGKQLTAAWASNDPNAAAEWLKTLPAGEFHDSMARDFALQAVNTEPQLAFAWALAFPDIQDNTSPLPNVASQWLQDDPTAATAAIRNSGLPADVIESLLKPEPPSGTQPTPPVFRGRPSRFNPRWFFNGQKLE